MRYLRIYAAFVAANLKELLAYRAHFYSTVVVTSVWIGISVVSVLIYSSQSATVAGWTRQELLGLTGVFSLITGLSYMVSLSSFFKLVEKIHKGTFDYDLVKPLDSQFTGTMSRLSINNLARFVAGIILITIAWPGALQIVDFLKFLGLTIISCLALYSSWVLLVSLNFYSPRLGNIIDFLLELFDHLGKTPSDALREANTWLFTFLLPFVMVLSFPVKSLWGQLTVYELGILVGGGILSFILARLFWLYSLRHYTSASS